MAPIREAVRTDHVINHRSWLVRWADSRARALFTRGAALRNEGRGWEPRRGRRRHIPCIRVNSSQLSRHTAKRSKRMRIHDAWYRYYSPYFHNFQAHKNASITRILQPTKHANNYGITGEKHPNIWIKWNKRSRPMIRWGVMKTLPEGWDTMETNGRRWDRNRKQGS